MPQRLICTQKRESTEKCAGGAQIFTECRYLCKAAKQEHGANAYEQEQNNIFPILQYAVKGQPFSPERKRNPVQQVLQKSERAEPSAYKPAQQTSEQEEKAEDCEWKLESLLIQKRLQSSDRAGGESAGTGITVQARHTGEFQFSPVDFSVQKTICITVREDCVEKLDGKTQFFPHRLTRFRCIPDRS